MREKKNWMKNLTEFKNQMGKKIEDNAFEKGYSWRKMSNEQLLPLIQKYIERRDFVSVANIAFMLWENSHKDSAPILEGIDKLFEEKKRK